VPPEARAQASGKPVEPPQAPAKRPVPPAQPEIAGPAAAALAGRPGLAGVGQQLGRRLAGQGLLDALYKQIIDTGSTHNGRRNALD
jgi:hypothetical protein